MVLAEEEGDDWDELELDDGGAALDVVGVPPAFRASGGLWEPNQGRGRESSKADRSTGARVVKARQEVDFRFFCEVLWPRMAGKARNKAAVKALSASAVFQEIQSYIKGSARALDAPKGRLSRDEYLHLGQKMAPNFRGLAAGEAMSHVPGDVRGHRDLIYDLYEAYEEEKRAVNGFDLLDLVFHIWSQLQAKPYSGAPIHAVYVDETQDLTQAELRLVRHEVREPSRTCCGCLGVGVLARWQLPCALIEG